MVAHRSTASNKPKRGVVAIMSRSQFKAILIGIADGSLIRKWDFLNEQAKMGIALFKDDLKEKSQIELMTLMHQNPEIMEYAISDPEWSAVMAVRDKDMVGVEFVVEKKKEVEDGHVDDV